MFNFLKQKVENKETISNEEISQFDKSLNESTQELNKLLLPEPSSSDVKDISSSGIAQNN